jgi:4-amino-4-deoxy-L-arabinose transferase-like glycosyltransferase
MANWRLWLLLMLAVIGTVVPLAAFAPFVLVNGFNPKLFLEAAGHTPVSRFFTLDVLISAFTLFLFMALERRRLKISNVWVCVVGTLLVGVSLGLPLFLFFRELKLKEVSTIAR